MTRQTFVAIAGGGITGLALANNLRTAGVPHLVLEASDRVGGVVRSRYIENSLLEWGPQRTRLSSTFTKLVDSLGVGDQLITGRPGLPLFVYASGRLRQVPFSLTEFITSDIVPLRSKLRVLLEPFTRGADPDESVAGYFTRKVGRRLYENMAGPLYGGLYASDPASMVVRLSLGHVLSELGVGRSLGLRLLRGGGRVSPTAACSFRDGMETLPRALHAANAAGIQTGSPVEFLSRQGEDWLVEGPWGSVSARHLVITTPAPAAAGILAPVDASAAEAIASLRYNPLAIVHLYAQTPLEGLGYQVSLGERLATRGVTFNASLFDRDGVYTVHLGGAKAPEVVTWRDEEIAATAIREFRTVTGADARVLHVDRGLMPAWDTSWAALEGMVLPQGITLAANWESRPGIPGRLAQAGRLAERFATAYAAEAGSDS
ncbi:MAG: protoporphyrinogen oxidase [Gemmatimonadota bacterium]|jgi:oxygen-dependent protoporphyrinogen oxidase|nr:protoporphyrinogen oxidase [Gemmatimonadota bacterium]